MTRDNMHGTNLVVEQSGRVGWLLGLFWQLSVMKWCCHCTVWGLTWTYQNRTLLCFFFLCGIFALNWTYAVILESTGLRLRRCKLSELQFWSSEIYQTSINVLKSLFELGL